MARNLNFLIIKRFGEYKMNREQSIFDIMSMNRKYMLIGMFKVKGIDAELV